MKDWRVKEKTWQWEIFHNSYQHRAVPMSEHPGSLLPWYHILLFRAAHTQQMYTDRYRYYIWDVQRGREWFGCEILLHFMSVQNTVLIFICFPKSPEHQPSYTKPRPRANAGAALSSTAVILNIHGKQTKTAGRAKEEDEVNSNISSRPATHTACPGVGLHQIWKQS